MPGAVHSIIVGGGLRAINGTGALDVYPVFADTDVPASSVKDGNIRDSADAVPKVYIGDVTRPANVSAGVTILGGAVVTQGSPLTTHGQHIVIGDGTVVRVGTPAPLSAVNPVVIGVDNNVGDGTNDLGSCVVIGYGHTLATIVGESLCIGTGNTSLGTQAITIGMSAINTGSGPADIVIGQSAVRLATGTGPNFLSGVVIGPNARGDGPNSVAIGPSAVILNGHSTAIGAGATCSFNSPAGSGAQTALGALASCGTGQRSTMVGYNVKGQNFTACYGLGAGMRFTANNQFMVGTSRLDSGQNNGPVNWMHIGGEPTYPSYVGLTWECVNGEGTDNSVGDLTIKAPRGTGNASGGRIIFQTGQVLASGATVQAATTRFTINSVNGGVEIAAPAPTITVPTLTVIGNNTAGQPAVEFTTFVDAAAAAAGTLTNAPSAGDPAMWLPITINGVAHAIPVWAV